MIKVMVIAVDKSIILPLILMGIFIPTTIIMMTGIVPEIFKQGEQLDIAVQQRYEDQARANQTVHEDLARDLQERRIIDSIGIQLDLLQGNITDYIKDFERRAELSFEQRADMISNISLILENLQDEADEHEVTDMDIYKVQEELNNITKENKAMLAEYRENSIKKFDKIIENQQKIVDTINHNTSR